MKTRKLNKRYSEIKTLKSLELERDRLAYRLGIKEADMQRHFDDVKEALTFSNICRTVWSKIDGSSFVAGWNQGMSLFSTMFQRKRKKHTCSF